MRTFAIPLEKMSGIFYRPAQAQGTVEIIEKTEGTYKKQVPNKIDRERQFNTIEEGQEIKKIYKEEFDPGSG